MTLKNRAKIPDAIEINVDTFNDKTRDGKDEKELVEKYEALVQKEKIAAQEKIDLSGFEMFCLYGGLLIGAVGIAMLFGSAALLGVIAIIAGIGMVIHHFSQRKVVEETKRKIGESFEEKREAGVQIIRAMLAEVVECGMKNASDAKFCAKCGSKQAKIETRMPKADETNALTPKEEGKEKEQGNQIWEQNAFAQGLPKWSLEPPQVMVRRKRK